MADFCRRWVCLVGLVAALLGSARGAETISPEELAKVKAAQEARVAVIQKVYGAVVCVYGKDRQGGGSGVIYDEAGYALTNYHVVAGAGKDGFGGLADGKLYPWKLIGIDPGGDVAIIKLSGKEKFPAAPIGNSDHVRVGDFVMAMGNPFLLAEDQRPTVTLGVVSGVKRYQHGQTPTMLVYGNCIQVDSSINPGNSGGPLFSDSGEVIGINGRGSFKERGRVNVGVGYAISSEQCKNFIPELLATKVCLHGTLDAVFGNRKEGVICEQLNLDKEIAKLGLQLGDRLVAFDGVPVENANQFTNILTTIPAGWPVEVTFEHEGEKKTVWLRLPDLPYGAQPKRPKMKLPPPDPKKPNEPLPKVKEEEVVEMPLDKPGKINDKKQNQEEYRRIVAQWRGFTGVAKEAKVGVQWKFTIRRDGKEEGTSIVTAAADGRWSVSMRRDKDAWSMTHDGKETQFRRGDAAAEKIGADRVAEEPLAAFAASAARLLAGDGTKGLTEYELEGSDRVQRQRSYRLRGEVADNREMVTWFSLFDERDRPQVRLLKTAGGKSDQEFERGVACHEEREIGGLKLPQRLRVVAGLSERVETEMEATACQVERENVDGLFKGEGK